MSEHPGAPARPNTTSGGLLESFLPGDRRMALADGSAMSDRPAGAGLFADISGFTALAEALVAEHGRLLGAEALGANLNRVYQALVDDLFAYHGEVLYFSGDAITCWLDGDDGARAVRCALDMQATMASLGEVSVPGGSVSLSVKITVAVGWARRVVVGDPEHQLMDVLGGRLIDWLAFAESHAERGEVVVDQSALESLGDRLSCRETRGGNGSGRRCAVVDGLAHPPSRREPLARPELPLDAIRPWILPQLYDRLVVGGGLFLGELRRAHPIFVRFGGFEFDDDPDVEAGLDAFVREVQRVLGRYDGTLLGITVGDKGAYLNAVVGAPRSHEDDAHRAVAAAVEIRDLEPHVAATDLQVGVSVGEIYSATYGHRERRTYSVLGDPTNLSARLMSKAPAGEVYVLGDVADAVEDRFTWTDVPPLVLKGKSAPVRARAPVIALPRPVRRVRRYPLPIVGRDRELAEASTYIDAARHGERRVLAVAAEPGMGKSRFVAEVLREAEANGLAVTHGQAESIGRTTSYGLWREVWRRLFGVSDDRPTHDVVRDLERVLGAVDPNLQQRTPLLAPVIGLEIPDNEFVAQFDAKLRKTSLETLLGDVLAQRASVPLVVVLEDLQWMDPLSADLLTVLVRRTADLSVLFLLSYRREPGQPRPPQVDELPSFAEIALAEVGPDAMRALIGSTVRQTFGSDVEASDGVVELVLERAQGNPFYAEELVRYLHRISVDLTDPAAADAIDVPDNLNTIVLSRIDGLEERPRQALKVASVVGREFRARLLGRIHGDLGDDRDVVDHLDVSRGVQLIVPLKADLADWQFRHSITREVAYGSLPRAVRTRLHEQTGDVLVSEPGGAASLDVLAHHFWHSENLDKQRTFLRLAGDAARGAYSNAIAIEHYRRLAQVTEGGERAQVLLDLAGVLELTGDWAAAEENATRARELSVTAGDASRIGWCDVALAETARKRGHYDDAGDLLTRAAETFTALDDQAGLARVLHLQGTIAAQHNDLAGARSWYEASRRLREQLGDRSGLAGLLSNLGVVAEYEGDYPGATEYHERALELRREIGDRWAIAVSHQNLGMIAVHEGRYADARNLFEEAMRLNVEVGDAWMVAITHHNLGNANRGLGEHADARSHFATSLATYRAYDDRWSCAFLLEDLAVLAAADEPSIALELVGAADTLRAELDAARPAAMEEQLAAVLDEHLGSMPAAERAAAVDRGRVRATDEALALAAAYCAGDLDTSAGVRGRAASD